MSDWGTSSNSSLFSELENDDFKGYVKTITEYAAPPWMDPDERYVLQKSTGCIRINSQKFIKRQFYICVFQDNLDEGIKHSRMNENSIVKALEDYEPKDQQWYIDGGHESILPIYKHLKVFRDIWQHGMSRHNLMLKDLVIWHSSLVSQAFSIQHGSRKPISSGLRTVPVHAGLHQFLNPVKIEESIQEWIKDWNKIECIEELMRLFRQFLLIHPFEDGNGRMARMLLNHGLARLGITNCPVVLTSGHQDSRKHYYQCLKKYDRGQRHHLDYLLLSSLYQLREGYEKYNLF